MVTPGACVTPLVLSGAMVSAFGARVPDVNRVARVPCVVSPCLFGGSVVVVSDPSDPFVVSVVVSSTATVAAVVDDDSPEDVAVVKARTQKCPSPSKPSWHAQLCDPGVLVQRAFAPQARGIRHSSTSARERCEGGVRVGK